MNEYLIIMSKAKVTNISMLYKSIDQYDNCVCIGGQLIWC